MKFNRYKIVDNGKSATWRYSIYKRSILFPFWLEWKYRDILESAKEAIKDDKHKVSIVHIE